MAESTTIKSILKEADSILLTKRAAELNKTATPPAMQGIESMPGSEKDKSVDKSMESPNPEVKQELPPGGTDIAGAEEADKLESGHAIDGTQDAPAQVDKEPLTSADAMANPKTGSAKMANDLLSAITKFKETDKTAAPAPENAAAPAPKNAEAVNATNMELTTDVLAKIASVILSSSEGWDFAEQALTKEAGAEAARSTMDTLQKQAEYNQGMADAGALIEMQKQAEYDQGAADADALINYMATLEKQAQAAAPQAATPQDVQPQPQYNPEMLQKLGQALADAALGGENALGAMAGPEAGSEAGPAAGMPQGNEAMNGGEPSVEELKALISQLTPEELAQLQEYLAVAGQVEAGAGNTGGGEEAAAVDGMPVEGANMEVAASAVNMFNQNLAAALQKLNATPEAK